MPRVEQLTLDAMLDRFVYGTLDSVVYDKNKPGRTALSYANFKTCFKGLVTHIPNVNRPIEMTEAWLKHVERETVYNETFIPNAERIVADKFNTWACPWCFEYERKNRVKYRKLYDQMFKQVFPNEAERGYAEQWFAHIVQEPDNPATVALVNVTTQTGTGRGVLASVMRAVFSNEYVTAPESMEKALNSAFNEWRYKSLLTVIHEATPPYFREKYRFSSMIKTTVSDMWTMINPKGRKPFDAQCFNRLFLCTNNVDGVVIDRGDRRIAVTSGNKKKMSAEQALELTEACSTDFVNYVATRLMAVKIEKGSLFREPPMTPSRRMMMELSISEDVHDIANGLKREAKDLVSWTQLKSKFLIHDNSKAAEHKLRDALKEVEAQFMRKRVYNPVDKEITTPTLWVLRNHHKWFNATPEARGRHYYGDIKALKIVK
jgi:hypothetical protein